MAYQARQRDPLFDSETQAVIERRGKELLGLGLLVVAVAVALMLGSYVPEDPSWLSATDEPARNLLGRFGASIASPLFVIVGWGAWAIVAVFGAWGLRFLLHVGEERAPARLIFAPLAIALVSVYASTHVPAGEWTHSFGLGGLFGDTVLGAVLGIVPVQATLGLKMIAAVVAAVALVMSLFVLGCSKQELRLTAAFLLGGVVMSYAGLVSMLGRGAHGVVRGSAAGARAAAEAHQRRRDERAQRRAEADDSLIEDDEPVAQARPVLRAQRPDEVEDDELDLFDYDDAPARGGVLSRLSGLFRRRTEPQDDDLLEEPAVLEPEDDGTDDRIRAKIADVIKARVRARPILTAAARPEPPVQRPRHPRGPQPMILPKTPRPEPAAPAAQFEELVHYDEPQEEAFDEGFDPETLEMPESELVQPEPSSQSLTAEPLFETGRRTAAFAGPAVERKKVQHPPKKVVQPSRRAQAEAQPALGFDESDSDYEHPPLNLLTNPAEIERHHLSDEALEENARMLETVLDDYGVKGEIVSVRPGPVVTMYELEPAPGLKASRVIGLADDIARSMSALSARVSTVPGRSVIGIELPNSSREKVVLREILSARDFGDSQMKLPLALGKDIGGEAVVANLAKMPHLLIAGTTGSGKSVAINTMILSLLYKLTPEECRLIMIDPKMLELSVYDGIPHLLSPVVTDPKKAVVALKWVVAEMEDRYRKMSRMGVRNIEGFNGRVKDALSKGEMFKRTVQTGFDDETGDPVFETEEFAPEALPYIVVIVDEMADLMMVAGKEIEACIQRLAQMARASGIHLIMATQRPSVDVITGTIKANFPTRISFQVTSKIDSRTILGEQGAEQLLGMGDMLYMAGGARLTRVHGPFVSDEEVEDIVNYLKQFGPPDYVGGVVEGPDDEKEADIDAVLGLGTGGNTDGEDALYDQAVAIVIKDRKCSTSYIQRKLAIGYNKAARLVEQMEDQGVVSSANHVGKREILVPEQA